MAGGDFCYYQAMADLVPTSSLSKEVLPPQKPNSGLGIMLVASLAMFFAVASSAFVLRARTARSCPTASEARSLEAPPEVMKVAKEWHEPARDCGTPEYRTNPDGSTTVFFEVCPEDRLSPKVLPIRSAVPADDVPPSIEVREIRREVR